MNIPRKINQWLQEWTADKYRKVLLLRGARQVGKTYAIRQHAQANYKFLLEINFNSDKKIRTIFQGNLDVNNILEALAAIYAIDIIPRETLLFFDEIQECPEALEALRFFYEKRPDIHVIGSGSLLEFALEEMPSFGVGRIQSLFMHPVSFDEYLEAAGETLMLGLLARSGPDRPCPDVVHEKLLTLFKNYLFHGGLPEVVSRFLTTRNYHDVNRLLDQLRTAFEDDFVKYQKRVPTVRLREVFRSVSLQAGMKFVHSHAYPDANAGQVHTALELLNKARIIHKIYHTSANGVPLGAEINLKKFKTIPFDHGIYQRTIGVTPAELMHSDFDPINKGALAEVYMGCALMAHSPPYRCAELFYWHREAKSSNAEVDYVAQIDKHIVPIEVKSAAKGKMKSMQIFLGEKSATGQASRLGIRLSLENFGRFDNILVLPLYAVSQLERIFLAAN